jgi:hypothetical protein
VRGIPGTPVTDGDGNTVQFWIDDLGATYRASTCVTLVALCEDILDHQGEATSAAALLARHPEIPASRQNRAAMVADAFNSAVQHSKQGAAV